MTLEQWLTIADRLVAAYPGAELPDSVRGDWYLDLKRFPAELVLAGVHRCRCERFTFPSLATLRAAILAERAEAARARHERERAAERAHLAVAGGVPMPPETRQALALVARHAGTEHLDPDIARQVERLADQLDRRTSRTPPLRLLPGGDVAPDSDARLDALEEPRDAPHA
jgi:hypothetical protein